LHFAPPTLFWHHPPLPCFRVASPCRHHAFEVMGPQRERGRSPRQSHVFHFADPAHPCRSLARACEAHRNARQHTHTHCTHADKLRPADARPLCSNDAPPTPVTLASCGPHPASAFAFASKRGHRAWHLVLLPKRSCGSMGMEGWLWEKHLSIRVPC
jgi:hypothetical protein